MGGRYETPSTVRKGKYIHCWNVTVCGVGPLSSPLTHQLAFNYRLVVNREDEEGYELNPSILYVDVPGLS